jgi:exodeoxyribonuclease-3
MQREGRFLAATFADFQVISLYLPSGSSGADRQAVKYQLLAEFANFTKTLPLTKPWVIAGDFNIAHTPLDLKNWRSNQKNSGFLPEERAWLSDWLANGWRDSFRHLYPDSPGYTWWTYRGQAFAKDVGWRIDYQCINQAAVACLKTAEVLKNPRFSDHAALSVHYDFKKLCQKIFTNEFYD